jgi:hypothetical protein
VLLQLPVLAKAPSPPTAKRIELWINMQFIDDAEFQINIDLDNGARIDWLVCARDADYVAVSRTAAYTWLVWHGALGWAHQRWFD